LFCLHLDLIKDIRDPEKPQTLEDLNVVSEENVVVKQFTDDQLLVQITFVPTVPHCSLASLIGKKHPNDTGCMCCASRLHNDNK